MMKKAIATLGIGAVAMSISAIEASAMEKGKITASPRLNIRTGAGTNYPIIGKANYSDVVELLEEGNGWYKVKLSNGTIGWGSSEYIEKTNQDSNGSSNIKQPSTPVQGKRGKITASPRLNIRSGAGTNYSIVGKVNYSEVVDLLEISGAWYKVKLSNGTVGWGSSEYIIETTGQQPDNNNGSSNNNNQKPEQPSTSLEGKRGKITASPSLNIRSGAGSSYSVIGKSNYSDVVDLIEKSNGWYKVKLSNGIVGWGSGDYIIETTEQLGSSNNDNINNQEPPVTSNKTEVVNLAYALLGTPYAWGAEGPNSFDCSGFTKYVYSKSQGKNIPRVSREQAAYGVEVSRENYAPGDLVYFDTDGDGVVNHVGIYVGGNEFIHCSGTPTNPDKVKMDNLSTNYWSKVLLGARRF